MGGAEGFAGAGDEDEGDGGESLAEERELGEEVAAYAAGSWGVLGCDEWEGGVLADARDERARRKERWITEYM